MGRRDHDLPADNERRFAMLTLASRRYLCMLLLVLALIALLAISMTVVLPAMHHVWVHGLASGSTPDIINHNH
jgi:hypothetical protein